MIKHCGLPGNTRKKEADNNAKQNYVFIIDEINRGNISKIFGELITLIEPSKRLGEKESMKVTLPCSGDVFGVPNNVYILGTMNTADRSIAMIDTALRRRFNFVEMMPDTDELSSPLKDNAFDDIDVRKMLKIINERIEYLYDREHTIGHAFFIGVDTLDKLSSVFKNKVIPLLQEYFYDDYKKIRLVLGDNGKDEKNQFIKKAHPQKELFKKGDDDDDLNKEKNIYKINQDAFDDPKSYKGII
ncbi:MAG: AAA family ATPase [Fibrobacteraceae bacterium]|nr:AAA family ATPase [Fibrobacteraceae bacterium]